MARLVKIEDLTFDQNVYPRLNTDWHTAYQYAQAMRAGAIFPPIEVGMFDGKQFVIDGWHRCEAKKDLKEKYIKAKFKRYDSIQSMFLDAVKMNVNHGRPLSSQEKARIIDKLKDMKFEKTKISEIIRIPLDKIHKFEVKIVKNTLTGETVYLKSPMEETMINAPSSFSAMSESSDLMQIQRPLASYNQMHILSQLAMLLENDAIVFTTKEQVELGYKIIDMLKNKLSKVKIKEKKIKEKKTEKKKKRIFPWW